MTKEKKYHYVYKTTNTLTNKFYIGMHSTNTIDDGYLGSGTIIRRSIRKYGSTNHTREIMCYCDDRVQLQKTEQDIVNETLIKNHNCMNLVVGGKGWSPNSVVVRNSAGMSFRVPTDDPRYISGELVPITTGMVPVKDSNGNTLQVNTKDPRYVSGELVPVNTGTVVVVDNTGISQQVDVNDPRYVSGELKHIMTGKVTVRDNFGVTSSISTTDPRYTSGELKHAWTGSTHTSTTKDKMSAAHKRSGHQKGSKNSQHGKVWVYSLESKTSKSIPKSELDGWLQAGWFKGRKMKF